MHILFSITFRKVSNGVKEHKLLSDGAHHSANQLSEAEHSNQFLSIFNILITHNRALFCVYCC